MPQNRARKAVQAAFARRVDPGRALGEDAERIALACRDMALRFHRGGKLIVFGDGGAASDAEHVAVEFMHPVLVGKEALPAVSLNSAAVVAACGAGEAFAAQIRLLGAPVDIALGISGGGDSPDVLRALRTARELGLLAVALVGADGADGDLGIDADHVLIARSADPCVVKEVHVTAYHVLWELVHVFLQQPQCHEDVCVTCSDAAVPVRVREILGDGLATVDTESGPEEISVALVDVDPGDVVLVHAKEAIARVEDTAEDAAEGTARGVTGGAVKGTAEEPS